MSFKEELKQKTARAEQVIASFLPKEEGFAKHMAEAMNYSMRAGGKRLRPVFMAEMYELLGGTGEVIRPFMAAMEMIHTHSLIHDDLPALDNDEYRRGKKTTHVVFGESAAILAGDALLNYAYETAFRAFDLAKGEKELRRTARALEILGEKTGIKGMLGGQGADVENDGKPLSKDMLDFIYENKTSALIEASLMIGAVLVGTEDMVKIEKIGSCIGLAFQIQDDILDVTSSREELGKPVGSDAKNNKTTYVTLEGIEKAGEEVKRRTEMAIELLDDLPGEKEFLKELFLSLCTRRK
ncbi:MAG: polyprenyl synthetase family protein [Blautia hansenii]